jgi:hypothetical protein
MRKFLEISLMDLVRCRRAVTTGCHPLSTPEGVLMELFQEVATCPKCETRLTVCGQRLSPAGEVTAYDVGCPVCWTEVSFVIPGTIDPIKACLICYERPS